MAEKKVILKDGADELLPKTSASMVFTESGQTVEAALQNAGTGGGGTGGGIDEEQLAQYLQQHQYVTQTALEEAHYLKPTSEITGYAKASNYTSLAPTDTLNEALGKLEAGIGIGGEGGEDVYYLPGKIMLLKSGATNEEITDAFGGLNYNQIRDAILGKRVYIEGQSNLYLKCMVPVSVAFGLGINVNLQWIHPDLGRIYYLIYSNVSSVKIIYIKGYDLDIGIRSLTSNSNTDEISAAVGGESGLKSIIQAVKDGNRLVIRDDENGINQDLSFSSYLIEDNGDISLSLSGIGPNLWGGYGGILTINYTKSSNTFSCTVIPISMGS